MSGLWLLLYRPIRVGDSIQLTSPKGLTTAMVEVISLGFTKLRDAEDSEIIVPKSIMMSTVVVRLGERRNVEPAEARSPAADPRPDGQPSGR